MSKNNIEIEHISDILQAKVTIPKTGVSDIDDMVEYTIKGLLHTLNGELETIKENPHVAGRIAMVYRDMLLSRGVR